MMNIAVIEVHLQHTWTRGICTWEIKTFFSSFYSSAFEEYLLLPLQIGVSESYSCCVVKWLIKFPHRCSLYCFNTSVWPLSFFSIFCVFR